ncbi:hypothetical protein GCM10010970_31540 [Silvimonas iriomotensis]|uniref:Uncharacterized protein n=1 Tax=Silvimonas iriomotensis TaxID=449662 RepID=A0ABQ2PD19_9NEIS|nr:hypothetical protein GCM10010970_31540 [Silvimonas iriomotensis]
MVTVTTLVPRMDTTDPVHLKPLVAVVDCWLLYTANELTAEPSEAVPLLAVQPAAAVIALAPPHSRINTPRASQLLNLILRSLSRLRAGRHTHQRADHGGLAQTGIGLE